MPAAPLSSTGTILVLFEDVSFAIEGFATCPVSIGGHSQRGFGRSQLKRVKAWGKRGGQTNAYSTPRLALRWALFGAFGLSTSSKRPWKRKT